MASASCILLAPTGIEWPIALTQFGVVGVPMFGERLRAKPGNQLSAAFRTGPQVGIPEFVARAIFEEFLDRDAVLLGAHEPATAAQQVRFSRHENLSASARIPAPDYREHVRDSAARRGR